VHHPKIKTSILAKYPVFLAPLILYICQLKI
jgi:hypothetical protein